MNEDRDLVLVGRVDFEEAVVVVLLDLRELVQLAEKPKIEIWSHIGRLGVGVVEDIDDVLIGEKGTLAFEFEQFCGRFVYERWTMFALLSSANVGTMTLLCPITVLQHVAHVRTNADHRQTIFLFFLIDHLHLGLVTGQIGDLES